MPAALLAAYWAGGEAALIITAIAIPGTFLALGGLSFDHRRLFLPRDSFTGLLQRDGFEDLVEHTFEKGLPTETGLLRCSILNWMTLRS